MGTKRKKKTVIANVTRDEAEQAFTDYAKAQAEVDKITASIELECAKIREKHQSRLAQLECDKQCAFDTLEAFATNNKDELFSKKKSLDMAQGTIGFRTGTPKLKTLKGFTWASALELAKRFLPFTYIRQTEDIAKDKLLADRDSKEVVIYDKSKDGRTVTMQEAMAAVGIQCVQEETFYVEPKAEDKE
ncbi:MAG: host-nuclease inhibitor Gam family protein [Prevotella sp.]|nr:host-nuclease inhibitor Gam family protein [Prevotella sp.]